MFLFENIWYESPKPGTKMIQSTEIEQNQKFGKQNIEYIDKEDMLPPL